MAAVSLDHARRLIVEQCYAEVLPAKFRSDEATVLLLSIGLQESRFRVRQQIGGPARSFWQFEKGGIRGVLEHDDSAATARAVCQARGIMPTVQSVYARMLEDDLLGCAFARLLLWTDSAPLPRLGNWQAAWAYYERNWCPGKPHPGTWPKLYGDALAEVRSA